MAPLPPVVYLLEFAGEDDRFAGVEARVAAEDVTLLAPGVGAAKDVALDRAADLAYTRQVSELLARTRNDLDILVERLAETSIDRTGTVAVRARDVRGTAEVDTQTAERRLGQVLVDRGFTVDLSKPDHTLVALFADDLGAIGWQAVATKRHYGDRAPTDRPFFQPGSMEPLLARAVINLAGVQPGDRVLDPMCGTGGLLIEAGLLGAIPIGVDAQPKMVAGTRTNLEWALGGPVSVLRGDGTALPFIESSVDAVVVDVPYGRQSKIAVHGLEDLVRGTLSEAARVGSRAVLVADREYTHLAREAGWTLEGRYERPVHRSLTRHVHVLT